MDSPAPLHTLPIAIRLTAIRLTAIRLTAIRRIAIRLTAIRLTAIHRIVTRGNHSRSRSRHLDRH